MKKFLCTWLGEVCYSCSLTVLPGPAWVVLNYELQRIFSPLYIPVLPRYLIRRQVVCAERAEAALLHGDEHVVAGGEACRERRNLA